MAATTVKNTAHQNFAVTRAAIDDFCVELFADIFQRAKADLKSRKKALQMDAYYWMACPNSELYREISRMVGTEFRPDMFSEFACESGLPAIPEGGVLEVILDTEEPNTWCFWDEATPVTQYREALKANNDELMCAFIARINGCEITPKGRGAEVVRQVIEEMAAAVA